MVDNYSIEINPTNTYEIQLKEQGPQGNRGETGNGIVSYEKTGTDVLVDIYTITFTNGNTQTVKVNNGKGITNITGPSSSGLIDIYTINYNDGTTSTFEVKNGNGITDISKTSTSGLIDTYTIEFSNGDSTTFTVTNGEKGDTGNGISNIELDITSGGAGEDTTDYIVNYTNGSDDTISVYNSIIEDVTATITGDVGTPSVTVTDTINPNYPNRKSIEFEFKNLKGNKGDKGDTGDTGLTGNGILSIENDTISSDIDTTVYDINYTDGTNDTISITNSIVEGATATVNNNVGTPDVNVTTTSDATHPNRKLFNFQFLNLKGDTGNTGPQGISVTGVTLISTVGLDKTYRMTFSNNTYFDYVVKDGAAGAAVWGGITGVLSNQTDLNNALNNLQSQIDTIIQSSDVFDIVGTYADLQNYDISTVPVNDIIKVLVDSTHSGAATYYRCVETNGVKYWSYIGAEGAYYTKAEANILLAEKQNIINSNNKLSADYISGLSAVAISNSYSDLSNLPTFKTINNNSIIGSGNIDIESTPEIYWATIGTTTYNEVNDAITAGKMVFATRTEPGTGIMYVYTLVLKDPGREFHFEYVDGTYAMRYTLTSGDAWSQYYVGIQSIQNLATSISSSSGHIKYPSAKAVWDALTDGLSTKQDIAQPINALSSSGTITLTDNSINSITPTAAVTFTLPTVTDTTTFHQILVQMNLSTLYSITLGTSYYFNNTAPDLSSTGVYNLIFEYDNANNYWVVGCVSKGAAS